MIIKNLSQVPRVSIDLWKRCIFFYYLFSNKFAERHLYKCAKRVTLHDEVWSSYDTFLLNLIAVFSPPYMRYNAWKVSEILFIW